MQMITVGGLRRVILEEITTDLFLTSMKWCKLILGDMNEDPFFQGTRGSVLWAAILQQSMADGTTHTKDTALLSISEMVADMTQVRGILLVLTSLRCVSTVRSHPDGPNRQLLHILPNKSSLLHVPLVEAMEVASSLQCHMSLLLPLRILRPRQ